jgi:hypothetical protein
MALGTTGLAWPGVGAIFPKHRSAASVTSSLRTLHTAPALNGEPRANNQENIFVFKIQNTIFKSILQIQQFHKGNGSIYRIQVT